MIGKGATPSFFAIANDNYTLTYLSKIRKSYTIIDYYNDKLNGLLWENDI